MPKRPLRFLYCAAILVSLALSGCSSSDSPVPTVEVPKGGKDAASKNVENPLGVPTKSAKK